MSNIFFTADGRKINLENFGDVAPAPPSQSTQLGQPTAKDIEESLRLKGNLSLDGTIRAGKYLMADGSEMKTIVNEQKVAVIPETVSFDAQGNMVVGSKGDNNKLKLSTQWSGFPDDKKDGAEISNDTKDYKTLMIVGNKSAGGPRSVSVWDKLTVNGQLCVENKCVDKNTFGQSTQASNTFSKGNGWGTVLNINAPVQPESLYSLHFGDGKALHERQAGMGYVAGQPSIVGKARGTLATHIHEQDDWQLYSSGWNPLFSVKGGTGNTRVKGQLDVNNGSRFKGDRHFFTDLEGKGLLRVGAAWGVPGIYSEQGDVVVGSQTGNIWLNGHTRTNTLKIGNATLIEEQGKLILIKGDGSKKEL
jgi:hypothetical protein